MSKRQSFKYVERETGSVTNAPSNKIFGRSLVTPSNSRSVQKKTQYTTVTAAVTAAVAPVRPARVLSLFPSLGGRLSRKDVWNTTIAKKEGSREIVRPSIMGFVTVLVQHAWALQPTTSRGNTPPRHATNSTNNNSNSNNDGVLGLSATRRGLVVSVIPETVIAFLRTYRAATTPSDVRRHQRHAADILDRLHRIVTGPALANTKIREDDDDDYRNGDHIPPRAESRASLAAGYVAAARAGTTYAASPPMQPAVMHCVHASRSSRYCPAAAMKETALDYPYEALDCASKLRSDGVERASLLRAMGDIVDALRAQRSYCQGGRVVRAMLLAVASADPLVYNMSTEGPGDITLLESGVSAGAARGTGKTLLARAVASTLECNFLKGHRRQVHWRECTTGSRDVWCVPGTVLKPAW
ncbi:hypothetical protein DFJ77DRAFT_538244 [Powellomyces hirtus]|nr:hypothetical protein DFJ77DRAFT_538244 [Powellomyces hirtus]